MRIKMEVNSNKQKRAELRAIEKAKQKEILAKHKNTVKYRLLTILGLDIIAISFLTYINNESSRTYNFVFKVLPVLTIIAAALTVAAAVYLIISKVKKINTSLFPVTPAMIFSSMLTMLGVCLLYKHMTTTKLILALIVLTVLYFVYHLYSRTFFKYSLFTAGAMFISEFFG